jgi:hypothetical protein
LEVSGTSPGTSTVEPTVNCAETGWLETGGVDPKYKPKIMGELTAVRVLGPKA